MALELNLPHGLMEANIVALLDAFSYPVFYLLIVGGNLMAYLGFVIPMFLIVKYLKQTGSSWVITSKPFSNSHLWTEFKNSFISILFFGINGLYLQWGHRNGWLRFPFDFTWQVGLIELFFLFLWNEIHFYFVHRLFHHSKLYRWHYTHHQEPNVSPFAIFSFHWSEALALGSVIPMALLIYPFHFESILMFVGLSMFLNTLGHSGLNLFKGLKVDSFFHFTQRHFAHHKFHFMQYGFLLPWFDQIFGTDKIAKDRKKMDRRSIWAFSAFIVVVVMLHTAQAEAKPQVKPVRLLEVNSKKPRLPVVISIPAGFDLDLRSLGFKQPRSSAGGLRQAKNLAHLSCEHQVSVRQAGMRRTGTEVAIYIFDENVSARQALISFEGADPKCTLGYRGQTVAIRSERETHPAVADLRNAQMDCRSSGGLWDCRMPVDQARMLKDPYLALSARFEALTGKPLSLAQYHKKDPNMAIDYSMAPKLDLVVFDTLQILNDFAGRTMLEMLKYHAAQGARVLMMTSRALLLPQERKLLKKFREENPEIELVIYSKSKSLFSPASWVHQLHRANHIKTLVTYSRENPMANKAIVGGRNQSEMYFYPKVPDNSAYPDIIQWNEQFLYNWAYFDDLDFEVTDTALVKDLAQRLLRFNAKMYADGNQEPEVATSEVTDSTGSFYFSYPFDENAQDLEMSFIQMIGAAQKSIVVISPYLNFTAEIKEALDQAKARGVSIRFYTNISVENDFLPFILQPAMTRFLREIIDDYDIHFYSNKNQTLHVKSVVIDGKELVLGSINWNQRSFRHDTEIAFVTNHPAIIDSFERSMQESIYPFTKKLKPEDLPHKKFMETLVKPLMPVL